jgi:hypothetical protein
MTAHAFPLHFSRMKFHANSPSSLVTRGISLPLFDWRTLAVIQAFACFAISCFVNITLLENPELYKLHPDGDDPASTCLQAGRDAARSGTEAEELQDLGVSGSTGFSGSEPASGVRRRSGEHADATAALADGSNPPGHDATATAAHELEGLTVRQALRRPIFWLIILSIFFIDVLWGGFNLHFVSVLEDQVTIYFACIFGCVIIFSHKNCNMHSR